MKKGIIGIILFFICVTTYSQRFNYVYELVNFKCRLKAQTVTITGFDQDATTVIIPSMVEYKGQMYAVDKVDTYISGNNYSARFLKVEEGIKEISNFSFLEFRKLEEVYLPESLVRIGKNTFADSNAIAVFNASDKIKSIVSRVKENDEVYTPLVAQNERDKETTPKEKEERIEEKPKIEPVTSLLNEDLSDVDIDIPQTNRSNEYAFAVIIANENYDEEMPVEYALNDGRMFKEYCKKLLGIPEENIRLLENASYMQIRRTMEWLKKVANAYSNEGRVYFYYAGHGMPDEKEQCAYILPADGYASDVAVSGYSLKELYEVLGALPMKSVTVFLDACFSGMKRDGSAMMAARSVAIKPDDEELSGKLVVFSATSDAETAYSYKGKGHGLFTYYLLKKLKESKGNVSYKELADYVKREVVRKSLTLNDKGQTPTINVAPNMEMKWKKINFSINNKK